VIVSTIVHPAPQSTAPTAVGTPPFRASVSTRKQIACARHSASVEVSCPNRAGEARQRPDCGGGRKARKDCWLGRWLGRLLGSNRPDPCLLVLAAAYLSGCLGVQVGTVYDYEQQRRDTVIGVYLEGFTDGAGNVEPKRGRLTYGARTTAMFQFDSRVDWSLQPEVNLPLGDSDLFATVAAGPAVRPWSVHTTGCVRHLSALQYGSCVHWLSEGKVSLDLNLGVFAMFPLILKDLGSWH
jgi:hypothetical protein